MTAGGRWIARGLLALVVVGLPFAGHWARQGRAGRCALDGDRIDPVYRVRIVDRAGANREFCCILCAERWLALEAAGSSIVYVTDEIGGKELPASDAYFVRSTVVTQPATGNRVHAFARRSDAQRHADEAHGAMLAGGERPLQAGR
jgi:hypothetical protein